MKIRPFDRDDVHDVASLWQYWFRDKTRDPDPALVALARRIYVDDPNADDEIRPLVAEDDAGNMLGFLGTSVMPVMLDGEERKLAGVFPSVVDPSASTSVASLLLRKFLSGPQAFTFSDGGHVKFERIWEALGGQIAQLQSVRWVKLFRPANLGAMSAGGRSSVRPFMPLLRPLAGGADWLARQVAGGRLTAGSGPKRAAGRGAPEGSAGGAGKGAAGAATGFRAEPLTPARLVEVTPAIHAKARMRPLYDEAHVAWQFGEMARITEQGEFTAHLVLTPRGEPAGWYVYYMKRGGLSRVFALEAHARFLPQVVDQLFADADRRGAAALTGRMEPRLRAPMAQRGTLLYSGASLQMVHSKDKSLMDDAQLGRLAYSRLQGENWYWWAIDSRDVP